MLRVIPPFVIGVVAMAFIVEIVHWDEHRLIMFFSSVGTVSILGLLIGGFSKNRIVFGLITWSVMVALGAGLTLSVSNHVFPASLKTDGETAVGSYIVRVVDEPQQKERSVKVVAEITDTDVSTNGKVLLYFKPDSVSENLKYGQLLVVRAVLHKVENLGNPNEFNYKRYLRFHGIVNRGYVKEGKAALLSDGEPGIWGKLYAIRISLIGKLKEAGLSGNELSVASALILGYRADLDKELMSAYAGAGATHVLAVSGLHVGIVYVILNTLLKFMDRRRNTKILKTILLILLLFGYAGLTGLSASVFRAATMFSFVAVGKAIRRDTNIFNTLAASAFCLIAIEPMIIMQVGFQLSYAAVIGIVMIQPRLFKLYAFPRSRLLDWAWSITCVSIAAQIATAPLGLLYFHQFPNFFWVSNLLVIPAAAAILYLGFALFVFSFWQPSLLFFGFLLEKLISTLNSLVMRIEQIPYAVLSGIDISTLETLMIYGMIMGILLFIIQKSRFGLYSGLGLAIMFMGFQIWEVNGQRNQQFTTIYNIRGETALALFNGAEVTFIGRRNLYNNEQSMLFHVRHHWWKSGIGQERWIALSDSLCNRVIEMNGHRFAILNLPNRKHEGLTWSDTDSLDFVLIDQVGWNNIEALEKLPTANFVISNTLGTKTRERLASVLHKKVVSVSEVGAISVAY